MVWREERNVGDEGVELRVRAVEKMMGFNPCEIHSSMTVTLIRTTPS